MNGRPPPLTVQVQFNVNSWVRVRLNDRGRRVLKEQHFARFAGRFPYRPVVEDEGGWSRWQLWALMEDLGQYCALGTLAPFDTEMLFEVDACPKRNPAQVEPKEPQ